MVNHIRPGDRTRLRRFGRRCAAAAMCVGLLGCASSGWTPDEAIERPLLSARQALSGARLGTLPGFAFGSGTRPAPSAYVAFLAPSAVVARNNIVYVFDSGHRQLFRIDSTQQSMTRFTDYGGSVAGMAVAPDLSLYVADAGTQQVLHYSWDGKPLPRLAHDTVLARPVAICVDAATGRIFVADSLYNHVVIFDGLGRAQQTLKSLEARSIESMARGPDGLYLVDRLSRQVVVMGLDGRDRYVLGEGTLNDPQAIAVDRFNRVFVSDAFDNSIKVYEGGQLTARFGGSGATPGRFNRVTFLSIDQNTLYVADSLNARVQSFHIAPPAARGPGHD
ncbi:hypothetical protein [Herbaspirillum sp. ST 5-3]|uniref:hypothetical protein n=2 Tax=Oxalobacteraceae TaxID=75682 RepID=UPI0010A4CBC4|nr:hypothetical protein [Herbaspirillum sp. ST 5-3]